MIIIFVFTMVRCRRCWNHNLTYPREKQMKWDQSFSEFELGSTTKQDVTVYCEQCRKSSNREHVSSNNNIVIVYILRHWLI